MIPAFETLPVVVGFVLALSIAMFSLWRGWLTRSGAVAQFFLGWVLFGLGGVQWIIPIFVFFLLSSLLSTLSSRNRPAFAQPVEKTGSRDGWQVLANGGVGGILVILWFNTSHPLLYVAYLGAVGASAADTWGTEAGAFSRRLPRLITTFEKVDGGTSGGVTVLGTVAGVLGACAVVGSGLPWAEPDQRDLSFVLAVSGGFFGFLLDSVLGATIQAQFECLVCGRSGEWRDHCGTPARLKKGLIWFRNDLVNGISTLAGAVVPLLTWLFLAAFRG